MLFSDYVGGWFKIFDLGILNTTLTNLEKLYNTKNIYPSKSNVFRAFHECEYSKCKVVMIGQDPYPQKNIANGILFSNNLDNKITSPSLKVIMEASGSTDQSLLSWCKQGVLMLNSALTVEENKPNSHQLLWRPFITSFLKNLSGWETSMIYLLFGSSAISLKDYINPRFNDILTEKHPSYYIRQGESMSSEIFDKTNILLKGKYNQTIVW